AAADLLSLTKPRLSSLVLVTTAGGWLLARPGLPAWKLVEVVGATALVVGGANALNCWLERDVDARMRRTRTRPLPAGRMRPATALAFGVLCAALALRALAWVSNLLTAGLAALAFGSYVGVYTPLKRRTSLATLVG